MCKKIGIVKSTYFLLVLSQHLLEKRVTSLFSYLDSIKSSCTPLTCNWALTYASPCLNFNLYGQILPLVRFGTIQPTCAVLRLAGPPGSGKSTLADTLGTGRLTGFFQTGKSGRYR